MDHKQTGSPHLSLTVTKHSRASSPLTSQDQVHSKFRQATPAPSHLLSPDLLSWMPGHMASVELFRPLPKDTDNTIREIIQQTFPAYFRQKYKWCFRAKFNMPYGVVHLKAKKQWTKGRTIISYFQSHYGVLLRATYTVLNTMIFRLLPQAPGQLSIPQLWHHIELHAVGFFNSVPQDRLIDAVQSLVTKWQLNFDTTTCHRHPCHWRPPPALPHWSAPSTPPHTTNPSTSTSASTSTSTWTCIFRACTTYF